LSPALVWPVTVLASGAGVGAAALLASRLLPRGHADVWEWKLRTEPIPPLPWTLPAALVLLVLVMVALDALRAGATPSRGRCALLVILLTLGSGALMMSLAVDDPEYPYRASAALLADMTMGYYLEATRVDSPRDWVSDVERRTSRAFVPERVATHPPGPTLYFNLARKYLLSHPRMLERLAVAYDRWSGDKQQQADPVDGIGQGEPDAHVDHRQGDHHQPADQPVNALLRRVRFIHHEFFSLVLLLNN
jgi:hypothetical protein